MRIGPESYRVGGIRGGMIWIWTCGGAKGRWSGLWSGRPSSRGGCGPERKCACRRSGILRGWSSAGADPGHDLWTAGGGDARERRSGSRRSDGGGACRRSAGGGGIAKAHRPSHGGCGGGIRDHLVACGRHRPRCRCGWSLELSYLERAYRHALIQCCTTGMVKDEG